MPSSSQSKNIQGVSGVCFSQDEFQLTRRLFPFYEDLSEILQDLAKSTGRSAHFKSRKCNWCLLTVSGCCLDFRHSHQARFLGQEVTSNIGLATWTLSLLAIYVISGKFRVSSKYTNNYIMFRNPASRLGLLLRGVKSCP